MVTIRKQDGNYVLSQERFLIDPATYKEKDEPSKYNYKWNIMLTYFTSKSSTRQMRWMPMTDDSIEM